MTARKILVVSGLQIFPPESGGMLRTASMINALVARGFDVTLYSMVGRKADYLAGKPSGMAQIRPRLREYVDRGRIWAALQFTSYRMGLPPFWITLTLAIHTPRELRELLDASDAIVIDFPFLHPVAGKTAKPVALNTHNVEADLWPGRWVKKAVAAIERRAAGSVGRIFCCSEGDRHAFTELTNADKTALLPNGIDPERFAGISAQRNSIRAALGYNERDRVLFFAASSFGPNIEALEWLKRFVAEHQSLLTNRRMHFLVAGSVAKQPFELPHLKVVGIVSRIEQYFAAADLAFNGVFRGSGTNLKMAEFIAAGLPILTSVAGMRGYNLSDELDCIAFTPESLASQLAGNPALDDPLRMRAMAKSAYENNKRNIDMKWCIGPLVDWLEETTNS